MAYQIIQRKGSSKTGRLAEGLAKGFAGYREQQLMNEDRQDEREKLERELANRRYGYELSFMSSVMPHMMKQPKFSADKYDRFVGTPIKILQDDFRVNADKYVGLYKKIITNEDGSTEYVDLTEQELRTLTPAQAVALRGSDKLKERFREMNPDYEPEVMRVYGEYVEHHIPEVKRNVGMLKTMKERQPEGFIAKAEELREQIAKAKKKLKGDRSANVYLGLLTNSEMDSILSGYQQELHKVNTMLEEVGVLEHVKEAERAKYGGRTVIEVANESSSPLEQAVSAAAKTLGGDGPGYMPDQPPPAPGAPALLVGQDATQAGLGGINMGPMPQQPAAGGGQPFSPDDDLGLGALSWAPRQEVNAQGQIAPVGRAGSLPNLTGAKRESPRAEDITNRPHTWQEGSKEKERVTIAEKVKQGYASMMAPVTKMKAGIKARDEKDVKEVDYQKWRMDIITNFKGDMHLYDLAVKYSGQYEVPLEFVLETMNNESSAGKYNEGDTKHRDGPSVGPMHVLRGGALKEWNQVHPEQQYTIDQVREAEVGTMIGTWYLRQMMDSLTGSQVPTDYGNVYGAYNQGFKNFMGRR